MSKFLNPSYPKTELEEQILEFLESHEYAALATVSSDGWPHVSSARYICEDDFDIYLVMKKNSLKFQNILRCPRIGLAIGDSEGAIRMAHLKGEAKVIDDPRHFIASCFENRAEWKGIHEHIFGEKLGGNVYVKVSITWLRWLDLDIAGTSKSPEFQHIFPQANRTVRQKVGSKEKVHA